MVGDELTSTYRRWYDTGDNRSTWRETSPSATVSTTNPTWTVLESKAAFCLKSSATNHLSYGTVPAICFKISRNTLTL
jgi:hypothetical protein